MSTNLWTPGPWVADKQISPWHGGQVPSLAIMSPGENATLSISGGEERGMILWPVAWVHPYGYKQQTLLGDAALIAAAPDMLEALNYVRDAYSTYQLRLATKSPENLFRIGVVDEAIRKAEGGL